MSTGLSVHPDGRILCSYNIARNCQGYVWPADLFTYPNDDLPSDVCRPCGELDWQRYLTEHYG